MLTGTGTVGGMALARIYVVDEDSPAIIKRQVADPDEEYLRLLSAVKTAAGQLKRIMENAIANIGRENGEILDYQLLMLEDADFLGEIKAIIKKEHVCSEYAVDIVSRQYEDIFSNMDNEYLRQRAADIKDLAKRLDFALRGREMKTLPGISEDSILAASDLTPSQTASINKSVIKGIILERGGVSSHSVIMARSMGIPCIIGVSDLLKNISHGDLALINGTTGEIVISPDFHQISEFKNFKENEIRKKQLLYEYVKRAGKTLDGFEVKVYANITSEKEAAALLENGAEGVGLFRTEFMYMAGSTPPTEEQQYKAYSNIAGTLGKLPFTIRTLDAGGDKQIPYLGIPREDNPFLGYRAIRYCLDHPEIFKTQLSAILRSGVHGNIKLMIPMIATLDELRRVKKIIAEVETELSGRGIRYKDGVKLGMMMETPAAAFLAERFAKEVDFFSIGTNDLTQYLFAADRQNPLTAGLNSFYHPALLKTVKYICDAANLSGTEVDICGQAGEVPALVPIWTAMGVNILSVNIPSIPGVRKIICETDKADAAKVLEKALSMDAAQDVEVYLKSQFRL